MEMCQVAGVTYMSTSSVGLPAGAHWLAIRSADLKLKGDESPVVAGHEQIDGTDTTHYTFTIDMQAASDRVAKVVDVMSFSHFDEPVSVSPPLPSDTIAFSKFPTFFRALGSAGQSTTT